MHDHEYVWQDDDRLCALANQDAVVHALSAMGCTGKKAPIVGAAIARERVAFLWAMGRPVAPAP
jgi:hypothetical protein